MSHQNTALITGGMGGVGQATAKTFSQLGYRVALFYRKTLGNDAETFVRSFGQGHFALRCDISNANEVGSAVERVANEFGHLDVLVHAASDAISRSKISATDPDIFRSQFEATVFGGFNVIHAALPFMRESSLIVGITTTALDPDFKGTMPAYVSAKFALRGLLRELARELQGSGIRVNAVAPDLMKTALTADLPARLFEFAAKGDPRGRITTPEDVAEKIRFLLSPEGSKISGMSFSIANEKYEPL